MPWCGCSSTAKPAAAKPKNKEPKVWSVSNNNISEKKHWDASTPAKTSTKVVKINKAFRYI